MNRKFIVRFDVPFLGKPYCPDGIVDLPYTKINEAYKDYLNLKNNGVMVDLIAVIDGEEFCLM